MTRGLLLLGFAIVCNAMANIMIKVGMSRIEKELGLWKTLIRAAAQPPLWLGLVLFGLALATYSLVLTRLNLSVAYPIMVSMGLVIVVLVSTLLLGEKVTLFQLLGFGLIIASVGNDYPYWWIFGIIILVFIQLPMFYLALK